MAGTVSVACNLPNGVILQTCKPAMLQQPVMGGGTREVTEWRRVGKQVKIRGNARRIDQAPDGPVIGATHAGTGYAITHGVDEDFWKEWLEQNATSPMVVNRCIFANAKPEAVDSMARNLSTQRSGLEPVDPANLPREFRKVEAAVRENA